jgi:hypothetical protein
MLMQKLFTESCFCLAKINDDDTNIIIMTVTVKIRTMMPPWPMTPINDPMVQDPLKNDLHDINGYNNLIMMKTYDIIMVLNFTRSR